MEGNHPAGAPDAGQGRAPSTVYADSPGEVNFVTLQQNLESCLAIVDNEVMKDYVPSLQQCKDIEYLTDCAEEEILRAKMPAAAKCSLLAYAAVSASQKFDAAAAVAYELFFAEPAFAALSGRKFNPAQQKRFLAEHLTPPATPIPEQHQQTLLCLIAYRHAQLTEDPAARLPLESLIEPERKPANKKSSPK